MRKLLTVLIALALLISLSYYFSSKMGVFDTNEKNVYGEQLKTCCTDPMTGFYRNGKCQTGSSDLSLHVVCATMTQAFLDFSKEQGNDLTTAIPESMFPGLKPGDCWCLNVTRWIEALKAGHAPPINLDATHQKALEFVGLDVLELYSIARHN